MSASRQPRSFGNGNVQILVIFGLITLMALLGTAAIVPALVRLLPTKTVAVEIVDRDRRESGGGIVGSRAVISRGWNYFVTVRAVGDGAGAVAPDGEKKLRAPKDLYERALPGLSGLNEARLHITQPFGLPVAVDIAQKSVIEPGSILDKIVNLNKADTVGDREAENLQHYSLLAPIGSAVIAGPCFWLLAGYLIWKFTDRNGKHRLGVVIALLVGIIGGTWWALAG